MLDIKEIRKNPAVFIQSLQKRGADENQIKILLELDNQFRALKQELDQLKHDKNKLSLEISLAKKEKKDIAQILQKSKEIDQKIEQKEQDMTQIQKEIKKILHNLPNLVDESVPIGKDENSNKEVKKVFEPKLTSKDVLAHYEIAKYIGLDFERGVKLAGSRFTVIWSKLAKLERALANFMLDLAIKKGYIEVAVPYIVNTNTMFGTGQYPKFIDELYKIEGMDYWLIPTAEVPLTNLHANEILDKKDLPLKYVSLTPCFRKEAGNYQKDIKGIIRQHQFNKVELVRFSTKEQSNNELEKLVQDAADVLEKLQLPYRVIELCSGDLGFAAAKTYDLEVWIPSQDRYREISSCSNCKDFQARRANIKYRDVLGLEYVHTLNGSGLAVGRTLVAIIENYQLEDGIEIPKVLRPYVGIDKIEIEKNKKY